MSSTASSTVWRSRKGVLKRRREMPCQSSKRHEIWSLDIRCVSHRASCQKGHDLRRPRHPEEPLQGASGWCALFAGLQSKSTSPTKGRKPCGQRTEKCSRCWEEPVVARKADWRCFASSKALLIVKRFLPNRYLPVTREGHNNPMITWRPWSFFPFPTCHSTKGTRLAGRAGRVVRR